MNVNRSIYPPPEVDFLGLLKELQPVFVDALNSLGGKKPTDAGSSYLGRVAFTVNRAADGYLFLRESGRMDASKLLIRPALEAVFCGTAAMKNKEFLFRKAYSEWEEDNKLFAKDAAGKKKSIDHLEGLKLHFKKHSPDCPVICKKLLVQEIAEMAGLLPLYEGAYRVYCKFTHSAMRAVSGNLNDLTDIKDTHTMVWCVIMMLNQLKQYTPAKIPDLKPFGDKLALLKAQISRHPPTTRMTPPASSG